jgi:UDP-glucose:glycoprotein glucosyltransferase
LLAAVEYSRLGEQLSDVLYNETIGDVDVDVGLGLDTVLSTSSMFMKMSSFCGTYAAGDRRYNVLETIDEMDLSLSSSHDKSSTSTTSSDRDDVLHLDFSVLPMASDIENIDSISIVHLVDPLSLAGQRSASLISLFRDQLQMKQQVIFVPKLDISNNEFPLQNFYRYVLGGSTSVNDPSAGRASYKNLPKQHTLTVRLDAPENWNIQATVAEQDGDNLQCKSKNECGDHLEKSDGSGSGTIVQTSTTTIGYKLKSILVAGSCFESAKVSVMDPFGMAKTPPNGLQLVLKNIAVVSGSIGEIQSDTLVMQNLGYYQLAASEPGLYGLVLAEGRGSDLFSINGAARLGLGDEEGKLFAVRSFSDSINAIKVTKKPGKEAVPLLEGGEDDDEILLRGRRRAMTSSKNEKRKRKKEKNKKKKGMMGALKSMFNSESEDDPSSSSDNNEVAVDGDGKIHVFSLATGHMYERLLRIMMLSVTKRSSMPVKFWLFENYLSPTFKEIANAMSIEYGFEVGYVTYKWPAWLTQQTQKQRIIWGYKILFLDVLFPLSVKKVIYVDADQVVRADLKELWDLDLEGKPYAYTPFCTSREETLGFQFWRQGYWHDHLQGRPYHISALYVVDLANFR